MPSNTRARSVALFTGGAADVEAQAEWAAYDQLPVPLRNWLRENAPADYSAEDALADWLWSRDIGYVREEARQAMEDAGYRDFRPITPRRVKAPKHWR